MLVPASRAAKSFRLSSELETPARQTAARGGGRSCAGDKQRGGEGICAPGGFCRGEGGTPPGAGTTTDGKPYTGDTVSVTGTAAGAFATRHVGTAKAVTVTGLSLTGADAITLTGTITTSASRSIFGFGPATNVLNNISFTPTLTNAVVLTFGGTGIVTIGGILGMAAHLEGKGVGVIDMAGLAQKGGAVFSHMRIAERPEDIHAIRVAAGGADLVLGGDIVVVGNKKVLSAVKPGKTAMIVNTTLCNEDQIHDLYEHLKIWREWKKDQTFH